MIKIKHFKSGGTLIYKKSKIKFSVVHICFPFGKRRERYSEPTAHFLEHMLFKGTKKRKYEDFKREATEVFSYSNAYTSNDVLTYVFKRANKLIEPCFELASDSILNSALKTEHIETEKKVIKEELARALDNDNRRFHTLELRAMGNSVDNTLVLGSAKQIDELSQKELKKFREREFTRDNLIVSIVGNMGYRKAKKLIEKYLLQNLKSNAKNKTFESSLDFLPPGKMILEKRPLAKAIVSISVKIEDFDLKARQISLLLTRYLNKEYGVFYGVLRDAGLVYVAKAGFSDTMHYFTFRFECTSLNINKIIDVIAGLIKKLKADGVPQEEIEKLIKEQKIIKDEHIFSPSSLCRQNLDNFIYLGEKSLTKKFKKEAEKIFENIKTEDTIEYAKKVFSKKENICAAVLAEVEKEEIYSFENIKEMLTE